MEESPEGFLLHRWGFSKGELPTPLWNPLGDGRGDGFPLGKPRQGNEGPGFRTFISLPLVFTFLKTRQRQTNLQPVLEARPRSVNERAHCAIE
jgi:hypothetical protein